MTASTKKSAHLTTFIDSIAGGILDGKHHGGRLLNFSDTIPLLTTDMEAGDIIGLIPVKSSDSLKSLMLFIDDVDSHSTPEFAIDVGILRLTSAGALTATGGDADVYADASTLGEAANIAGLELAFITRNITKINNEIWQDAGLSADPRTNDFVIAIVVDTVAATPAAGDLTYQINIARS